MTLPKISQLRALMAQKGLTAYLIPNTDPHQGEYLAAHWQQVAWFSGFTGSAATVVITADFVGLWTDSRYFLQAETQLQGSGIELMKLKIPHTPEYRQWLVEHLPVGAAVGIDERLFSVSGLRALESSLKAGNIRVATGHDLIGPLWADRPPLPSAPVFAHEIRFAGKSRQEKLAQIRQQMQQKGVQHHLLSALDDIAWTFNVRGSDIEYNPVAVCYALIDEVGATLFIDPAKVPDALRREWESEGIQIAPYASVVESLGQLPAGEPLLFASGQTSQWLAAALPAATPRIEGSNIPTVLKAVKNEVEQAHIRFVMVKDGVAMLRFFKWLEEHIYTMPITEISAAEKLHALRAAQPHFTGDSFGTIAGYGPHGAIVHYSATPESDLPLQAEGLFLLDSGGQYLDGTTDITRTVSLGTPTAQQMRDFTLVLKGHIALARAVFPAGTQGQQLDALARQHLWQAGLNFGHGTGHGVGFFLNVHEGPQRISPTATSAEGAAFVPGMLTSNEPGLYRTGEYGIRIENLILVVPHSETEFGVFYQFETVSLCPIDTRLVETESLNTEEREWLNQYHERVKKALAPHLDAAEQAWLAEKCRAI